MLPGKNFVLSSNNSNCTCAGMHSSATERERESKSESRRGKERSWRRVKERVSTIGITDRKKQPCLSFHSIICDRTSWFFFNPYPLHHKWKFTHRSVPIAQQVCFGVEHRKKYFRSSNCNGHSVLPSVMFFYSPNYFLLDSSLFSARFQQTHNIFAEHEDKPVNNLSPDSINEIYGRLWKTTKFTGVVCKCFSSFQNAITFPMSNMRPVQVKIIGNQ